ncbi:uncharacterized protein LOC109907515 isoform X2 [Oncorhynchus kisutch]|uniref:uncharacterized protein LOC109907515 isoform X2 n=1 Tax=Oncorhynchus kisutch TaxID=8019 RepID=UPI0009A076A7|nr:uncharacterized protein LOC109907515 isoform X2 [Oncorhynchus kisutch]
MFLCNEKREILPERSLQLHLHALSKSMSCCAVERLCVYLLSSRTITEYESQVIWSQRTDMEKAAKLLQVVLKKGRNACLLFFDSLEKCCQCPPQLERVTGLPERRRTNTAPTYVINISHSNLSNCIIGDGNFQGVTTCIQQPQSMGSEDARHETMGGNVTSDHQRAVQACPDPELQRSVQVYGSQLQYVIIGDNNNLQAEDTPEEEDGEEEELINKSN